MRTALSLAFTLLVTAACSAQRFTPAAEKDSVTLGYKWVHKAGKPSALSLQLANPTDVRRRVHAEIDLYYQGFTVEQFTADTLIGPHRTLTGKLNGIYFEPKALTPEQARSNDTRVEVTSFTVGPAPAE